MAQDLPPQSARRPDLAGSVPAPTETDRDCYEVLGVEREASLSTIRQAYRNKLICILHPEEGKDQRIYVELRAAYEKASADASRSMRPSPPMALSPAAYTGPSLFERVAGQAQHERPEPAARAPQPAGPRAQAPEPELQPPVRSEAEKAELPPRLQAALEGRTIEGVQVPPELEKRVPHLVVTEKHDSREIMVANAYPMIEDSQLGEGQVLVHMHAIPLSFADLVVEQWFSPGDFYGMQGIGQVCLCGPKVTDLIVGDWVVPLREVDEDGDLVEEAALPGTGRALAVFPVGQCARLTFKAEVPSVSQMAVAKSIGAAFSMVERYAMELLAGDTVIVNCANGVVGQTLVQLLHTLEYNVIAVIREETARGARDHLHDLGASKVLSDFDDDIGRVLAESKVAPPRLAFDGVGGDSTRQLASSLDKTGAVVCYGFAGGSQKQVLPAGWKKKWRGACHQFWLDEWLQEDLQAHSEKLSEWIAQAAKLVKNGKLRLDVRQYSIDDFAAAVKDAAGTGRTYAVVVCFPTEELQASMISKAKKNPKYDDTQGAQPAKPVKMSWDLDFLDWEQDGEEILQKRNEGEEGLFKLEEVAELQIQQYVDDTLAAQVALELGAEQGKATSVLFWLPGAKEVPEEHAPWLYKLTVKHIGLRVLILKPKLGFKWFDLSDSEAVKLGLRFGVADDMDDNLEGDPAKSSGDLIFPPLDMAEIDALQQIEGAAMGLARRAMLEEKAMQGPSGKGPTLPFFFGGFGQGGSIALFTAICLMPVPVSGVAFCLSGLPVAGILGKRLTERVRMHTLFYAIYDRSDPEVPAAFPEAIAHMFSLLDCNISLEWVDPGEGHNFFDGAASKVKQVASECLAGEQAPEGRRFGGLKARHQELIHAARSAANRQWGWLPENTPERYRRVVEHAFRQLQ